MHYCVYKMFARVALYLRLTIDDLLQMRKLRSVFLLKVMAFQVVWITSAARCGTFVSQHVTILL